jgi:hypothetical protein
MHRNATAGAATSMSICGDVVLSEEGGGREANA